MRIEAGVQFLFAKALIYKVFPIPFNDNRLYGDPEMVTVESVRFTPLHHLTKGLWGVHFEPRGVHLLIILGKEKSRNSYAPTLISVPLANTKVTSPFL